MPDIFDGTTAVIAGVSTTGKLTDVSVNESAPEIVTSGADADEDEFEVGVGSTEVTVTVIGPVAVSVGTKGATTITWADGDSDTLTNSVVTKVDRSGSKGGAKTTAVTVRPSSAAAG